MSRLPEGAEAGPGGAGPRTAPERLREAGEGGGREPGQTRTGRPGPSSGLRSAPGRRGVGAPGSSVPSSPCRPDAQECTLKVQDGKFKLQDLLVVPMQRVLKYHLLLKV